MSKQSSLVKNTLVIAMGKVSTQFLSALMLPMYTHYLTPGDFGTVDLIMSYTALLAPLATVQIEMAAFRFLIDARSDETKKREIISVALQIGGVVVVGCILLYVLSLPFVSVPYAPLVLLTVAATIAANLLLQIARGLGSTATFTWASMLAGVVTIASNIVLVALLRRGASGMLTSAIIANTAAALYVLTTLKLYRYIDIRGRYTHTKKRMLSYAAPLVPNGLAWWAINAADRTIITALLGLSSNGVYAVAYKFPTIFSSLFSFFGMSWQESASMHIDSPDRDTFFSRTIDASLRFFASLAACMIAATPFVFPLLVNKQYAAAHQYIPILIVGAFFNSVVGLYSAIYVAKKMTKQVASTSVFAACIGVGFTLIFTKQLGLYAASCAMVLAYASMALYRSIDLRTHVTLRYKPWSLAVICVLFVTTIFLYYYKTPTTNAINLAITLVVSAYLNRDIIWFLRTVVVRKRRVAVPYNKSHETN